MPAEKGSQRLLPKHRAGPNAHPYAVGDGKPNTYANAYTDADSYGHGDVHAYAYTDRESNAHPDGSTVQ